MKDFEPMKRGEWGFPEPVTTPPAQLDDEGDMLTIAWLDGFHRGKEKRPWVGLTEEQKKHMNDVLNLDGRFAVIDAIEAALKGNNA